jgi:flagellar biosynthesis protein FlhA
VTEGASNTGDFVATSATQNKTFFERLKEQGDLFTAMALMAFMIIMVVPLPPIVMDMFLAISITISLLVLLVTFYVNNPIEFSIFPTLLLATTLFRLSLNVATTRLILMGGHSGGDAAGNIIQAFGHVVVGGNYVVGLVVFTILVVINFVVITKGSGRVAEVAARFTLDAMPGKQMAIDAELNSGVIDDVTARERRDLVMREADFYGAMDGASKFIRGDAIAGILITLINIVGGIIIGVVQNGLDIGTAIENYTILTIGDGLVGQIPALVISAAAGMLVTRVPDADQKSLHSQFGSQLFSSPRALMLLSATLFLFVFIPGLRLPFSILGCIFAVVAWQARHNDSRVVSPGGDGARAVGANGAPVESAEDSKSQEEDTLESLMSVEAIAIELGVDLISLVDENKGGNLVERISRIRRQIVQDTGLIVPSVTLRDNFSLDGGEYRILLRGEEIGRGRVVPRQHLAINPGDADSGLDGLKTIDPVFGLEAIWIIEKNRLDAQAKGYTVVDVPTVVTTHLTEILSQYGHELYSRNQLNNMLERVAEESPKLVEELVPDQLSRASVLRVFRNLLREGVSVRDATTIVEALAEHSTRLKDPNSLTEFVRQRLSRHITHRYATPEGVLHYIALAPDTEEAISRALHTSESGAMSLSLDPEQARLLLTGLRDAAESWNGAGDVVVLCPPLARGPLRMLSGKVIPRVAIVSAAELLPTIRLDRVASVSLERGVIIGKNKQLKSNAPRPNGDHNPVAKAG